MWMRTKRREVSRARTRKGVLMRLSRVRASWGREMREMREVGEAKIVKGRTRRLWLLLIVVTVVGI